MSLVEMYSELKAVRADPRRWRELATLEQRFVAALRAADTRRTTGA